jgi:hypothetical protein
MRRLSVIALLLLLAAGCSEPPQKEIDQAQGAIDTARAAGADKYAADEYSAATSALQKAHDAVGQRDFRQALSYALDARERAQESARLAVDGKARARVAAEGRISDVAARIQQLEARLKAADAARVPARDTRDSRATLADARTALQKARTAFGASDYQQAGDVLTGIKEKVDAATRDAATLAQRQAHRKGSR